MAFENYVGRVGGLAIALGVGAAVATGWSSCPAWADDTGSPGGSTSSQSSPADAQGATDTTKPSGTPAAGTSNGDAPETKPGSTDDTDSADGDADAAAEAAAAAAADATDSAPGQDDSSLDKAAETAQKKSHSRSRVAVAVTPADEPEAPATEAVKPAAASVEPTEAATAAVEAETPAEPVTVVAARIEITAAAVESSPESEEQPPILIAAVSDPVGSDSSLSTTDPVSPLAATTVLAALTAVRDELERDTALQSVNIAAAQPNSETDDTPNVLVIGVDGTNLSRVLANPDNASFYQLILDSTTAAPSIVGHTTLSNPSWTAVLTGVWGETTGVINNIYNPAVYDRYPTVFNQLETLDSNIETTAIADWDVVAAIGASGSRPADNVLYVPQITGDTNWFLTDDAVGDFTEAAIAVADPHVANFICSYFVGVDENGHAHGGASPEYAAAITNVDRNLGEILTQVALWEAATGEQWTIIVVTDHGHMAAHGFGHGFQSPDETSTFVIANNPDIFAQGGVNSQYQIVDVTPTVVTLFGGIPSGEAQGVSLTTLDEDTVIPGDDEAVIDALQEEIAENSFPPFAEALTLSVRTIFASIPYFLHDFTKDITSVPVQFITNALYAATNFVAQIVARLTGVTGASIIPLLPPALPPFTPLDTLCADPANASVGACTAIAV